MTRDRPHRGGRYVRRKDGTLERVAHTAVAAGRQRKAPATAASRHPLDHDGDGRPGGSLPRAQRTGGKPKQED